MVSDKNWAKMKNLVHVKFRVYLISLLRYSAACEAEGVPRFLLYPD